MPPGAPHSNFYRCASGIPLMLVDDRLDHLSPHLTSLRPA